MSVALLLLGFGVSGCKWEPGSEWVYGMAVWADNGDGSVACLKSFYSKKDHAIYTEKKDFSVKVYIASSLSSSKVQVGPKVTGKQTSFHYMKSAGYFLLGVMHEPVPSGGEETRLYESLKMTLGGSDSPVTSYERKVRWFSSSLGKKVFNGVHCPLQVVPSPDGDILGELVIDAGHDSADVTVRFLDADDGSQVGSTISLDLPSGALLLEDSNGERKVYARARCGWDSNGAFLVAFEDEGGLGYPTALVPGWTIVPGSVPVTATLGLDDFEPATSSDPTDANGETLYIDPETGKLDS